MTDKAAKWRANLDKTVQDALEYRQARRGQVSEPDKPCEVFRDRTGAMVCVRCRVSQDYEPDAVFICPRNRAPR